MIDCGAGSGNDRNRSIVPDLYTDCLVFNFGVDARSAACLRVREVSAVRDSSAKRTILRTEMILVVRALFAYRQK